MKVLLTGAFGSLGSLVLEALLNKGHSVLAFDVKTATNARIAKEFESRPDANIHWGDIRDENQVRSLVSQVDAVVHLAAIIVPQSESNPELAYDVNVVGTKHIVTAIAAMECKPLLAYCSSFAVFGPQGRPPPRTLDEQPIASDHYTRHKIACENMVQCLRSPWVILRLGGMADSRMRHRGLDQAKYALSMSANNRFEYIHPKDAATAFVNALTQSEAHNKIHLVGGGPECQVTHKEVLNATLGAVGITLAESDFGEAALYADWADTSQAQRLLRFQHHSFDDFKRENYEKFAAIRPFVQPFSPVIKRLLKFSLRFY
jgi:nucleoside-diphosphate-sugar epimerase